MRVSGTSVGSVLSPSESSSLTKKPTTSPLKAASTLRPLNHAPTSPRQGFASATEAVRSPAPRGPAPSSELRSPLHGRPFAPALDPPLEAAALGAPPLSPPPTASPLPSSGTQAQSQAGAKKEDEPARERELGRVHSMPPKLGGRLDVWHYKKYGKKPLLGKSEDLLCDFNSKKEVIIHVFDEVVFLSGA